jgi:PAS domain S-box-containing protein
MTAPALSEDHYRRLVEVLPALVWRGAVDGKREYFNATWLTFTGRTLAQELGDGWTAGVHPDDFQRCRDLHLTSCARHEAFELEYRLRRHDGVHRWVVERGVPFHCDGELAGFTGSCVDVTELREADQAKETFITLLIRELRKPLMPLMLSSQQIQLRSLSSDPDHVVVAQRIERQVDRMRALVERASRGIAVTRGLTQPLRLADVDLGRLVTEAVDEHRQRSRARGTNIEIMNNGTWGAMRPLRADPLEIVQVLDVLLDNALAYSPDSGVVRVELSFEPELARIVVEDDGIGIPQADLPRVGTPYFRASNVVSSKDHTGMGLGLAVARDIVAAHGGTLTLSSCPDKGTRATVVLPLHASGGA